MKKKRLYFDIETSFNLCGVFQIGRKVNINHDAILKERAIICICYKWEGEKKVYHLQWDKGNDKKMLIEFIKVANEATELVGHNGDNFDIKWVRTRCFFHRIPMFPSYTSIDTLKFCRSHFRFNSNRLDYVSKFSGHKGKGKTDWAMWVNITMTNDQKDLARMVKYCKRDVTELENFYKVMMPYVPAKVHYGIMNGGEKRSCPECGNTCRRVGVRVSAAGVSRLQLACNKCGKHHTVNGTKIKESA